MKRKNILLIIGLIIIVAFTSHTFATDYNTGSSGSLNGLGSGSWDANPIGMRVSIVDSTGKLEVAKRVLSTQYSCSKLYNFNTNNKPKFLLSNSDTINRWASTNDYICTSYLPSNRGWLDTDNTTLNLNSHLSASDYSNLKSILSDSNFSDKLSPGDFIIIEPMTILGDYFGTAYELGNSFWEDENVSSWGDFVETYSGAIFGGLNKDGRRDGGLFYKTIYLDTPVTELGLTVYTDASTYDNYWNDIIVPRNNCLKSKTCGRGIGVYKYDDVYPITYHTFDMNGILDGAIDWYDLANDNGIYGTYDLYLNGNKVSGYDDTYVAYYTEKMPSGTTFEIKDIKANEGYAYKGYNNNYGQQGATPQNTSSTISGTISSNTSINLIFEIVESNVKIKKVNSSGNPIINNTVSFGFYTNSNCTGNAVATITNGNTGGNGIVDIDLQVGKEYWVKETSAPSDYVASGECMELGKLTTSGVTKEYKNKSVCESKLEQIIARGTPISELFSLYREEKGKGNDYRNLLNVSNPSCTTKDISEKEVENLDCLSASVEKDNFSEKNLSDYDEIVTDVSGNYIGFCSITMSLENNLQTNKFYSKAGQFLVKQNSKSIQYDSTGGSKTNVCGSSVSSANVQKACYVLTGTTPPLNEFYKTDKSVSVYFGDNDLNSQADKLPSSVKENSVTPANTTNSSLKLYNYEKKYNFGLNAVYLNKISGRASTSYIQGSTPIKGIISLFNSSSGTIPFKLIYDGKEYDSTSCKYETIPEIIVNDKLDLEFRSIDTTTPFERTPNSNWNDGSDLNIDDNQLIQDNIINATNSYGMLNGEKQTPLYRIELGPNDIKAIREYNKVNAYDNYSVECKTDMDGVTTCENTFLKGLENGYIKTKNEGGKQLNISNTLVSNSDSSLQYYNPEDSSTGFDVSSSFEDEEDGACDFDSIFVPVEYATKTTGNVPTENFIAGDEWIIQVKPGTKYHFFVLSTENDNVNLIMDRNICSDGTLASSQNRCTTTWYNKWRNEYGPVVAMNYLHNATKDWNNIQNIIINYEDDNIYGVLQKNGTGGYGSVKTIGSTTIITTKTGEETLKIENLKARLPYYSELHGKCLAYSEDGHEGSCPLWLSNYLKSSSNVIGQGLQNISSIEGYWTLTSAAHESFSAHGTYAWFLNYNGYLSHGADHGKSWGVRPVISIPKSYLVN